jgi:hypothetical protein
LTRKERKPQNPDDEPDFLVGMFIGASVRMADDVEIETMLPKRVRV